MTKMIALAALRFAVQNSAQNSNDLSRAQVKGIYGLLLEEHLIDEVSYSLIDFETDYHKKRYQEAKAIDEASLSSDLKLKIIHMLRQERVDVQLEQRNAADDLILPKFDPQNQDTKRQQAFGEKIKEIRGTLSKDASDFSGLSKKVDSLKSRILSLRAAKKKKKAAAVQVETQAMRQKAQEPRESVETSALAENEGFDVDDAAYEETETLPASVAENERGTLYDVDQAITTKLDQLHMLKKKIHDEKRELYLVRKLMSESITSINDSRIAHIVDHFSKQKAELEEREQLLYDQQALVDQAYAEKQHSTKEMVARQRRLMNEIKELEQQKYFGEQEIGRLRMESQEQEGQVYQLQQKLLSITRQIEEAQHIYDEVNAQAEKLNLEMKSSRDDLDLWQSELQDREQQLIVEEKNARLRLQKEREAMRSEISDVEQSYRNKLRVLEKKELTLDSQQQELNSLRKDLYNVKSNLEQEREDLNSREKEFNQQYLTLDVKEKEFAKRERNLNETTQKTLEYLDEKKLELQRTSAQKHTEIDNKMMELQRKELNLVQREQDLLLREKELSAIQKKHSRIGSDLTKQKEELDKRAQTIHSRLSALESYGHHTGVVKKSWETNDSKPNEKYGKKHNELSSTLTKIEVAAKKPESSKNSFDAMQFEFEQLAQHLPSASPNLADAPVPKKKKGSMLANRGVETLGADSDIPKPSVSGVPMPEETAVTKKSDSLLSPDDPAESEPSLEEVYDLVRAAEDETSRDHRAARATYNRLRTLYHQLGAVERRNLYPTLMDLFYKIQQQAEVASK